MILLFDDVQKSVIFGVPASGPVNIVSNLVAHAVSIWCSFSSVIMWFISIVIPAVLRSHQVIMAQGLNSLYY